MTTFRKRTQAREMAMKLLYQEHIRSRLEGGSADLDVERFLAEEAPDPQTRDYARRLYYGALQARGATDELIVGVTDNWRLGRIALVDLAILRLAAYELLEIPEVPAKVVLNEAIELAKTYSTAQSGAFVNGILDRLLVLREGNASGGAGSTGGDRDEPTGERRKPLWDFGEAP